jgi:hypothetical protein
MMNAITAAVIAILNVNIGFHRSTTSAREQKGIELQRLSNASP